MIKLMKKTFFDEENTKNKLAEFILKSEKLSMGEQCELFEKEFAKYQKRKFAVLVNSGSSANLALIQALINLGKLKKGDKIGFSAVTWSTNVMPIIQLGLEPIPIDISEKNLNVDVENLINLGENIKVLFLTNLLGFSGKIDKIKKFCEEKDILLLEDNCESLGSEVNGTKLGNFGFASTFSFFVGHHLSTIEGGMICTDDEELNDMLVMVRAHGWSRNLSEQKKSRLRDNFKVSAFYEKYTFYYPSFNVRPTEITGFLGLTQLKKIQEIHNIRKKNYEQYLSSYCKNKDFVKLDFSHMNFISNFAFPVICKNKNIFEKYLKKFKDVEIRPIVGGSMTEQPFFDGSKYACKNAKILHDVGFYIPNNPDLDDDEIKYICNILYGE